jgi:hypothetical protein
MKKIKIAALMVSMLMIGKETSAQKGLELTVKYNAESDKYEVYAKSNFTKKNFLLGPSQITLAIPALVRDEKLRIYNSDGGTWEDNTRTYAPAANTTVDYHAIGTLGAKTDLSEGNESLLFYFSLPKNVNPSEVRIFENGTDPNSAAAGMKGGDFSNAINDALADEVYLRNYKEVKKATIPTTESEKTLLELNDNRLILYPNTTKDDFNISLNGIADSEEVTMIVSTEMGREILNVKAKKVDLVEKTFKIPASISSQNLVVRVKTQKVVFGRKLILDRE